MWMICKQAGKCKSDPVTPEAKIRHQTPVLTGVSGRFLSASGTSVCSGTLHLLEPMLKRRLVRRDPGIDNFQRVNVSKIGYVTRCDLKISAARNRCNLRVFRADWFA